MPIVPEISAEDGILRVVATGTCEDLREVRAYVQDIHRATLSAGLKKVLVDERELRYSMSMVDTFDSAQFVAELVPAGTFIVLVCTPEGKDAAEFWGLVATNRGAHVYLFDDLAAAEEWIEQLP